MKKPSQPSRNLVYVHGTNGSGKSTLARALLAAAGGVRSQRKLPQHKKAIVTFTQAGPVFLGQYGSACGGVDGVSPYAAVHDLVDEADHHIFAEGLVTPGLETCQRLAERAGGLHAFVVINVHPDEAVRNVLTRRARKGTDKEYNPDNLLKKHRTAMLWADRLEKHGLEVHRVSWEDAYDLALGVLELPAPQPHHLF